MRNQDLVKENIIQSNQDDSIKSQNDYLQNQQQVVKTSFRFSKWRWLVLVIVLIISFLSYFCYDYPNALNSQIKEKITYETQSNKEVKFMQLYSAYSYPNIILPLFGGILIDLIGIYYGLLIFSLLCTVGQGVFTLSATIGDSSTSNDTPFTLATIGRVAYGIGDEIVAISLNIIISKWFEGKELSLAIGTTLSIAWFSNTVVNYSVSYISSSTSLEFALFVGFIACFLSLIFCIIYIYIDRHADEVDKANGVHLNTENIEKFQCQDLRQLKLSYWLIVLLGIFSYQGFIFNNISNNFFQERYGFTQIEAGRICSNVFLICLIFTPLIGIASDKFGCRISFSILGSFAISLCHSLYLIIPPSSSQDKSYLGLIPVVLMGLSMAIFSSVIYSMIPIIIKPRFHGTAFGVFASLLNTSIVICQLFVGMLTFEHTQESTYVFVNIFLLSISSIAILIGVLMYFYNKYYLSNILQLPNHKISGNNEYEEDENDEVEINYGTLSKI